MLYDRRINIIIINRNVIINPNVESPEASTAGSPPKRRRLVMVSSMGSNTQP